MMVHPFHPSLAHIDLPDPTDDGLLQTPKPAFTLKSGDDAGRKFGSPHIASPALAAWTPLVVDHESWQDAGAGGRAGVGALASGELLPAAQRGGAAQLPIAPLANTTTPRAHLLPGYPLTSHNQRPGTSPGPYLPLHAAFIYPGLAPMMAGLQSPSLPQPPASALADPFTQAPPCFVAPPEAKTEGGELSQGAADAPAASTRTAASAGMAGSTSPCLERAAAAAPTPVKPPARRQRSASVEQRAASAAASEAAPAGAEEGGEAHLTLEFLEDNGYFDMPIQQAASLLRVGVTTLKKVCRVNAIGRWPFRKRSSLNRLIEKTREYFADDPAQCAEALAQLEAQRSVLKAQQGEDIPEAIKRYRQSIFKLDYKVKKIVKERRTHRGAAAAAVAAIDKAHTMRQLGVGTPAHAMLGALGGDARMAEEDEDEALSE